MKNDIMTNIAHCGQFLLLRHKLKAHFLELFILFQNCHGNGVGLAEIKMKLNARGWGAEEDALVSGQVKDLPLHLLLLIVADPRWNSGIYSRWVQRNRLSLILQVAAAVNLQTYIYVQSQCERSGFT